MARLGSNISQSARAFGAAVVLLSIAAAGTSTVLAQDYPTPGRSITLIVGSSAGSGGDISARLAAAGIEAALPGSDIQVLNRPGGATQIALQAVADAPPDGYTLVQVGLPSAVSLALDPARDAQFSRDSFVAIGNYTFDPGAVAVPADSPYQTIEDLVAAARERPEEIIVGVTAPGGREHLDLMTFEKASGTRYTPVFFNDSGIALNTLLGGNINAMFGSIADYLSQVNAGRVRILTVFDNNPSKFVPDVPTATSAGYPVLTGVSRGFAFPAGTPQEIVDTFADALEQSMQDPETVTRIEAMGLEPRFMNAADYGAYWDSEVERIQALLDELASDG